MNAVIARLGAAERLRMSALRQVLPLAVGVGLLVWLAIVAARSALLVLEPFALPGRDASRPNYATPQMWMAAALITLLCLTAALLTRRIQATATLPVTFAMGGVVLLAGAVATGSLGSLLLILGLFTLAWLLGTALLSRLPATADVPLVRLPIATSLGLGLFGLLLLGLATLGWLNTATVVSSAGVVLLVSLLLGRAHLGQELTRLRGWRPTAPTWLETIVLGLTVGIVAYACLVAFVPEIHSDAVRHHLPIAREIWQAGAAPEFAFLLGSDSPLQAHLLYAVAYGLGDMTAAKLVHTLVGLLAIIGVAGIAWLGAGGPEGGRPGTPRLAAIVGAAVFATMPLVLWELGTAYVDLFPVLFTVGAVLAILLWQRDGHLGWLVVAGAVAGFGFAAKLTMGIMIAALVVAIVAIGRGPWHWRERLTALVAVGLGGMVVAPWLLRSYHLTGLLPGLSILTEHASGTATSDLASFGLGRSPLDLLKIPWHLSFDGERFQQSGGNDVGIVLLLFLPLALFAPRSRGVAFLAATIGLSFLGWAVTAQYTRYLIPTLALAAALVGIGVASALTAGVDTALALRARRLLALAGSIVLVAGLVAAPFLYLPGGRAWILMDVVTGHLSADEYVAEKIGAAAALEVASTLLPPDTPVGYFGLEREGAQLYTEARLTYFEADPVNMTPGGILTDFALLGTTPAAVLASLQRLGLDYFIWNRLESRPEDWRSTLLSTAFLRSHTRILAGDGSGYLFELLPDPAPWGADAPNLLADPALESVGEADGPWTTTGTVRTRAGLVSLRPKSALTQRVPVTAGSPYLLLATGSCETPTDRALLSLRWLDAQDAELALTTEWVIPGNAGSAQFLWQRAPARAVTVSAELATPGGTRCDLTEAALYALP